MSNYFDVGKSSFPRLIQLVTNSSQVQGVISGKLMPHLLNTETIDALQFVYY